MNPTTRKASRLGAGLVLALTIVTSYLVVGPTADAVVAGDWKAGSIISDADFYDSGALSETDIQAFLNIKGAKCVDGAMPCLRSYTMSTPATPAETDICAAMPEAASATAAQIIARVAVACHVSPKSILAIIQKESAIVTATSPTASMYRTTAGYGCPDTAACDSQYFGFFNQIYKMARQFRVYAKYPTRYGYIAGRDNFIGYNPNAACGGSTVFIENQATAGLYIYTPYQPNAAALTNMYGTGDSCSAYGNRNFWRLYNDWWGGTLPQIDPRGGLTITATTDGTITASGWAIDESNLYGNVTVVLTANGATLQSTTADQPYPILAAYGVPGNHGFQLTARAPFDGANTICVQAGNIGGGKDASLGCTSVTVTSPKINPEGTFSATVASTGAVTVSGWAADKSDPAAAISVATLEDGATVSRVVANRSTPAGTIAGSHGYTATWSPKSNGAHKICAVAINIYGGADTVLGCADVSVQLAGSPVGDLRTVTQDNLGTVTLTGWVFDSDAYGVGLTVMATVNGQVESFSAADKPFADLAFYGVPGNHGFTMSFAPHTWGASTVCVFAFNIGQGSNVLLGCRSITLVAPGSPLGAVDTLTRSGSGALTVGGWAWDPDAPTSPLTVMYTLDGAVVGFGLADRGSPTLAWYGIPGSHGYSFTTAPTGAGSHTVCVFAFNSGRGENRLLGCLAR